MIKQTFEVTILTYVGISETQLLKIVLEELAQYGLHEAEATIVQKTERPFVFDNDFHLEDGKTLYTLRKREEESRHEEN